MESILYYILGGITTFFILKEIDKESSTILLIIASIIWFPFWIMYVVYHLLRIFFVKE